jgi:hypothetical protein
VTAPLRIASNVKDDPNYLAEGFADSKSAAEEQARAACAAAVGYVDPIDPPDGSGLKWQRERYQLKYCKTVHEEDPRQENLLGSLWESHYDLDDGWQWTEWPITKITKARIRIRGEWGSENWRLRALDRWALEQHGGLRAPGGASTSPLRNRVFSRTGLA